MSETWAVVMAGGSGTRFWPIGRRERPKQLLALRGDETLIQATLARVPERIGPERTLVVTRADQRDALLAQVDLPPENVIGEPEGRDTCACIALAAHVVETRDPGATMIVMAADHVIEPAEAFHAALVRAERAAAAEDALVTFGVRPTAPATGYGYLETGRDLGEGLFEVAAFREKPNLETARRFLADGRHLWNAGIFVWRARVVLDEIARQQPALASALAPLAAAVDGPEFASRLVEVYPSLPKISIDYAVMERAGRVLTVAVDFAWDDIGSLAAIERHNPRDADGNTRRGEVVAIDVSRSIVDNREPGVVALIGVEDLVVIRTKDAVLVAAKDQIERVREVVARLEAEGRDEVL
ncbi:MAG: sugar phosphate nucleotidyltransferase [Planctomycetota bacterium]